MSGTFFWSGSDGSIDTRARVRWSTLILPRSEGGLAIIDPEIQIRALLSKLIVRGLFPGNEPWKKFFSAALLTVAPSHGTRDGHSWAAGMRFLFTDAPLTVSDTSPFMQSILRIWSSMRAVLIRREPRCREEIDRQPLIWNSYIVDAQERQLGVRTHVDWARWDAGPASSMHTWLQSRLLPADFLSEHYEIGRGTAVRMSEIDAAIPQPWWDIIDGRAQIGEHTGWWGYFDDTGTLLLVKYIRRVFVPAVRQDCLPHIRILFDSEMSCEVFPALPWQPVRLVGSRRRQREVDPFFSLEEAHLWRLWIWEGRPLAQLYWDPGEWTWPHHDIHCADHSFFAYTVRSARFALIARQSTQPTCLRMWIHEGLDHYFLRQFWATIWGLLIAFRICFFLWMITHRACSWCLV